MIKFVSSFNNLCINILYSLEYDILINLSFFILMSRSETLTQIRDN